MNFLKTNPEGIDIPIQKFQKNLFNKLNWGDINVYGRVYKNIHKNEKFVAEVYIGNDEYKEVFTDDTKNATIFFSEDDTHTTNDGYSFNTKIKVVVICNLKKIYPNDLERADVKAQKDVLRIFQTPIFNFQNLEKGVKKCIGEFYTDDILLSDMHPLHIFSITGEINYTISCNH